MAKQDNWFQSGKKGWKKAEAEDEQAKVRREQQSGPWRFRQKNNKSAKITFLDTPDFFIHEHDIKLNGRWGNHFTCLKDFDTCPNCENDDVPSYVVVATIIDHSTYITKEDKKITNQKKLFVAKGKARQALQRQIQRRKGDLDGAVYEIARGSGSTECATGEDFEFLGKLSATKLKKFIPSGKDKDWLKPFDYKELFAPRDPDEICKVLGIEAPLGSGADEDEEKETKSKAKEKDKGSDFDEDEVREELEALTTKTKIKKWAKENGLDIEFGPLTSTDKEEMVDQVIEAMAEAAEDSGGDSGGDDKDEKEPDVSPDDDDDLSIDDLL